MSNFVRHIGVMANTGSRVIIVYMQIPNAENRTLVVQPDSLPDGYRSTLNTLVTSPEGQAAYNFAEFLGRRQFEGSKKDILTVLHEAGRLEPMPIDNVLLTPAPNVSYPMRSVLEQMGKVIPQPGQNDKVVERVVTPFEQNQLAATSEQRTKMAQGFLQQAQLLENDARAKREEAYKYAPELRPRTQAASEAATATTATAQACEAVSAASLAVDGSITSATQANEAGIAAVYGTSSGFQFELPLGDGTPPSGS